MQRTRNFIYSESGVALSMVRKLIVGRLLLFFLIFLAAWWWSTNFADQAEDVFPNGVFVLFAAVVVLSTLYYLLAAKFGRLEWQLRTQFVVDVFLIGFLIIQSGDPVSPYISLFVVLIGVSGLFLRGPEVILVSSLSALCVVLLPALTGQNDMYAISLHAAPARRLQFVALNTVAILAVGLLIARMSERRRLDAAIIFAAESFADLHVLHERILESIRSGLITCDLQGRIYAVNAAAEEIAGISADELIGRSVDSVFGIEAVTPIEACIRSLSNPDFRPVHFEAEFPQSKRTAACSLTPLVAGTGEVNGLILAFQDLTDIRSMEESLRRADRLAAVGRMAAGLAHELRNPLGSMSAALQFLREKSGSPTDGDLFAVVIRESERLNRIITNFLSYARPEGSVNKAETERNTNVAAAIEDCLALLRHDPAVGKEHIFDCEVPAQRLVAKAGETEFKQVIWTLSQNAIRAMPDGGTLTVRATETPGGSVRIVVADTGSGIDPQFVEHVFEPFSSRSDGTGLGLSIVHRIVSDNGGMIGIGANSPSGTIFTVEMPLADPIALAAQTLGT